MRGSLHGPLSRAASWAGELPKAVMAPLLASLALALLALAPRGVLLVLHQAVVLATLHELYRQMRLTHLWTSLALGAPVSLSFPLGGGAGTLPVLTAALLLYLAIRTFRAPADLERLRHDVLLTTFGWLYVCVTLGHLALLLPLPMGRELALLLVVLTTGRNIAAGRIGPRVPGHPVSPFSPSKCYEHGLLALLVIMALAGALRPLAFPSVPLSFVLIACLLVAVGGMLGDLAESMLKRTAGLHASGRALGGVGGLLDVMDSYVYTAPLLYYAWIWMPQAA